MTREQVQALKVGDLVQEFVSGLASNGSSAEPPRYGRPREVVEVFHRGTTRTGVVYVNFFARFGLKDRISATAKEGDASWIIAGTESDPVAQAHKNRVQIHYGQRVARVKSALRELRPVRKASPGSIRVNRDLRPLENPDHHRWNHD